MNKSLLFVSLLLLSCTNETIIKEEEETNHVEMSFSNGSRMTVKNKNRSISDAYFFIRADGSMVTNPQNSKLYYPQNHNGTTYTGDVNRGEIRTDLSPYGIDFVKGTGDEKRYIFNTEGLNQLIVREPDINDMLNGSNLKYDSETMNVVWYVIKELSDSWHVDGVLVNKDTIPTIDSSNYVETKIDPYIVITLPDDIRGELICPKDDFYITVNNELVSDSVIAKPTENSREYNKITVKEENLIISITDLQNLEPNIEYTYNIWLWGKSTEGWKRNYRYSDVAVDFDNNYTVTTDVYSDVNGQNDTPYIHISIHVLSERN